MFAIYHDLDIFVPGPGPSYPGRTVVTVDGSDKGGVSFTSVGIRARWSSLGHSQYAVHPVAIGKCKEKDRDLNNLPLKCLLAQCRYLP